MWKCKEFSKEELGRAKVTYSSRTLPSCQISTLSIAGANMFLPVFSTLTFVHIPEVSYIETLQYFKQGNFHMI